MQLHDIVLQVSTGRTGTVVFVSENVCTVEFHNGDRENDIEDISIDDLKRIG